MTERVKPHGREATDIFTCLLVTVRDTKQEHAFRAGVPNLGYMYPQWYICSFQGVHWI